MNITISGLILASALMTLGCTQTLARHDLFERSDIRIASAISTARMTCREQQSKRAVLSAGEYERCVIERLQGAELSVARR